MRHRSYCTVNGTKSRDTRHGRGGAVSARLLDATCSGSDTQSPGRRTSGSCPLDFANNAACSQHFCIESQASISPRFPLLPRWRHYVTAIHNTPHRHPLHLHFVSLHSLSLPHYYSSYLIRLHVPGIGLFLSQLYILRSKTRSGLSSTKYPIQESLPQDVEPGLLWWEST